jgi:hypothetical protein
LAIGIRNTAICAAAVLLAMSLQVRAEVSGAPDVLVLGDSQLTFGAGAAFVDFFGDVAGSCGLAAESTVGVIGVRSSTLRSWTGDTRRSRSAICDVDPTWHVNAGAYGTLSQGENPYVQIGQGAQFQFCRSGLSPLEAVFADDYYPSAALADVQATMADLPDNQPCIFMTTAPTYRQSVVSMRQRAQDNLQRAFQQTGRKCSFVTGFTPDTIAANVGNAEHFRRNDSGGVRDPFHPTERAARVFLELERPALCAAIQAQLGTN